MTAKKRPQTKKESNKRYLARKKAKEEAALFEVALETKPEKAEDESEYKIIENMTEEDWNPHAPEGMATTGEGFEAIAQEPGPDFPEKEPKAEDHLEASPEPPETVALHSGHLLPQDTVERLQHAVDAMEWLAKEARNIPPRTKEILRLRRDRIKELIRLLS
jgi:hypothetical protein